MNFAAMGLFTERSGRRSKDGGSTLKPFGSVLWKIERILKEFGKEQRIL